MKKTAIILLSLCLSLTTLYGQSKLKVWANTGEDKVTDSDLRLHNGQNVNNSVWDGSKIKLFGAKNEVIAFNLVLEAFNGNAPGVTVSLDKLQAANGDKMQSKTVSGDNVFNWVDREIELFFVRYVEIKGVSKMSYDRYDERHTPAKLRRPFDEQGIGSGTWNDRPDHNKRYPDIAVPIESVPTFTVANQKSQSVWADIYIPKNVSAGIYTGNVVVKENGVVTKTIPVELTVRNFSLPDMPTAKTMLFMENANIDERHLGQRWIDPGQDLWPLSKLIKERHFAMAHRHKISIINHDDNNTGRPSDLWLPALNGNLFTAANGYAGPGAGVGNNVYSIATYGTWQNSWGTTQSAVWNQSNNWVNWFNTNSPQTEFFLYLFDEPSPGNYADLISWNNMIKSNPGVGKNLKTFCTIYLPEMFNNNMSFDIAASWYNTRILGSEWEYDRNQQQNVLGRKFYMYNGQRPGSGSFATEDEGVALRELSWVQYKKNIDRWFFWESTYYYDGQNGRGNIDVFNVAQNYGALGEPHSVYGEDSPTYSNGDGLLMYPGTDKVFTSSSYNLNGPIASLRLKHWRRGIQDNDYLALAKTINPTAVNAIVNRMVPKALWENGYSDVNDPCWVRTDISWSTNPNDWETARKELADIITGPSDVEQVAIEKNIKISNYPNPFNPTTTIGFELPNMANAKLSVYNSKGEIVKVLVDGIHNAGKYVVTFDGSGLNSGVYFYQLETAGKSKIGKMLLIK